MDDSDESITAWFHALTDGDEAAAARLWDRFVQRLIRLAKSELPGDPCYDEEDLAISVFGWVCQARRDGRYQDVEDRDGLWRLLVRVAKNKMIDRNRFSNAQRRSVAKTVRNSDDHDVTSELPTDTLEPSWEIVLKEQCQHLLKLLEDPDLESIALLRLDGYTVGEIAVRMGVSERTIKRRMAMIRKRWEMEVD